jgi:FKBP-type peptidyl-prolyl cis-trans isomerase FklB
MTPSLAVLLTAVLLATGATGPGPALETEREKQSYALGADLGRRLRTIALDVDPALVMRGVGDLLSGANGRLSQEEIAAALGALHAQARTRQAAALADRTGKAYLAANREKEGVVTLASGLQYRVLRPGSGRHPRAGDSVDCNYRGTLLDGTEFDSSSRHGRPATLRLGGDVVAGLAEALTLMEEGARWQIAVPPELAYGARGSAAVGPNATLLYEVELLAVR